MTAALLALAAGGAAAVPTVGRAPVPAWAVPVAVPAASEARLARAEDGIIDLLVDRQTRVEPTQIVEYGHSVYAIAERAGLERGARISIDFDPATDRLTLAFIRVHRGGAVLDRLHDAETDVLRRESKLDDDVVTGTLTASIRLRDIRVGDIVDYGYTIGWAWPGWLALTQSTTWSVPAGRTHIRYDLPATLAVASRLDHTPGRAVETVAGGRRIIEWTGDDLAPTLGEKSVAPGIPIWGALAVTTMRGWGDVAA